MVDIVPLSERPEFVTTVAAWHWHEWGHGDSTGSLDSWTNSLRERSRSATPPTTWVAVLDGVVAGSVGLLDRDMATHPELGPWLGELFVAEAYRGRGIGSALIEHAEDVARRSGHARLFLYTTTVESLYAARGWQVVSSERYGDDDVVIMARNL